MDILETQVAKITLGNFRQTSTFVSVLAEKAAHPDCELYVVSELPLFNPAATADCERIANALAATLRRSYKRELQDNTFEAALGEINEELGKLATLGQTNWIGKLNAVVAVKSRSDFNIATTGKVLALLLRDSELTDIADSPKTRHPLKTFENFATGKLKENDILTLSSAELSNYLSIDRLKTIIKGNTLGLAAQQIVKALEDNAGPEVAFGALLVYQTSGDADSVSQEPINLEEYLPKRRGLQSTIQSLAKGAKKLFTLHHLKKIGPHIAKLARIRPKVSMQEFQALGKKNLDQLRLGSKRLKDSVNPGKFARLSLSKQFLLIGAGLLFIAMVAYVSVAKHRREQAQIDRTFTISISETQKLIQNAESNLLFNDNSDAQKQLTLAASQVQSLKAVTDEQKQILADTNKQIETVRQKIEKISEATVSTVASLSAATQLITLPNLFATETNGQLISYNKLTNTVEDGVLKSPTKILKSVYTAGTRAVVYDGQGLRVWDWSRGTSTEAFYQSLPKAQNLVGFSYYDTNSRVYLISKEQNQIVNFLVEDKGVSKPLVWNKVPLNLGAALDLAIDGSIYILGASGVTKYTQGKPAEFNLQELTTPLSGQGKMYTNKDIKNLYVLDSGNNRVVIFDKKGQLVQILTSPQFTSLQDFSVDEANKTLYILNNGSLLKATY